MPEKEEGASEETPTKSDSPTTGTDASVSVSSVDHTTAQQADNLASLIMCDLFEVIA